MQHIQITSHKKNVLVLMIAVAMTGIAVILFQALLSSRYSGIGPGTNSHPAHMPEAGMTRSSLPQEALRPFQGQWHIHAGVLMVNSDGSAVFIARAYKNCGAGIKQPCDTWKGDLIIPGIREDITITSIKDKTAYGKITGSTDNTTGQQVTMTLQPQDMLLFNNVALCGPEAPLGNCGA